jgi:hypothetical protein
MPDITLVTVTYNAADVWAPFMASLVAQRDVDWHLVVIDNRSQDGTIDLLKAIDDPRITVILNDANVGVAAANNQGIKVGLDRGSPSICLINNDVEFAPDMLSRLEMRLRDKAVDAVSPLIPFFSEPDRIWYGGGYFVRARGVMVVHEHEGEALHVVGDAPFMTDYAPTCCILFDRSVFEQIGVMDERYFVYWDDTDFLWRMKQADMKLLVDPAIILLHKVSSSTGGRLSDFTIRYIFRNQIFFTRKFHGMGWALYSGAMAMMSGVVRIARNGDSLRHLVLRARALREGFSMK